MKAKLGNVKDVSTPSSKAFKPCSLAVPGIYSMPSSWTTSEGASRTRFMAISATVSQYRAICLRLQYMDLNVTAVAT